MIRLKLRPKRDPGVSNFGGLPVQMASYGAAKGEVMPSVEHRRHKGLNNRAENSHQPTRRRPTWRRERQMKRLTSAGQAQRSLSPYNKTTTLSPPRRDPPPPRQYRSARTQAFQTWAAVTGVAARA